MSEMSLQEQLAAIDEVIEYIEQVKRDIKYHNEKVSSTLEYLRQKGLRTEIIEMVESVFMGHINGELQEMLSQMSNCDQRYLMEEKERLKRVGGEQ